MIIQTNGYGRHKQSSRVTAHYNTYVTLLYLHAQTTRMQRIVAILSVVGIAFTGLAALIVQRDTLGESANAPVVDGIDAIANVSIFVLGAVGIFVGGIVVLFAVIAATGGR